MLDRWSSEWIRPGLERGAGVLKGLGVSPDQVTVAGFFAGMVSAMCIGLEMYGMGMVFLLFNRLADGLDGALARKSVASDAGGYLDIVLDFIFYAAVVFGFAVADPARNGLPAAALLFSFMGTGCSFLSFAIMAERRGLSNVRYPHKGFYYLGGLAEATETIIFFCLFCLFPQNFPKLAWIFASICMVTTATRVIGGYRTIATDEKRYDRVGE